VALVVFQHSTNGNLGFYPDLNLTGYLSIFVSFFFTLLLFLFSQ